jgi:hypothetical protein
VTSPEVPFTRIRWPVLMRLVADPVPVTAGRPYSRQTIAACDIIPPISVTVARILPNTGPQLGAMTVATRISPSSSRSRSYAVLTTRASPSTVPGEAGMPLNMSDFSPPPSQALIRSEVMPQSIMVNGSVITGGAWFSAGCGRADESA